MANINNISGLPEKDLPVDTSDTENTLMRIVTASGSS
jgi:ferritin-like protein